MSEQLGARFNVANRFLVSENEFERLIQLNVNEAVRQMGELFEKEIKKNREKYLWINDEHATESKQYTIRVVMLSEKEHRELLIAKYELEEVRKELLKFKGKERP